MARRPTVYDVAKLAGVSTATVSFAFRRPGEVRESTREAVLAAARELGYVPSGAARGLAKGGYGVLGIQAFDMMTDVEVLTAGAVADPLALDATPDPRLYPLYADEVQRGFELECRAHGWTTQLSTAARSPQDVADTAGRVDGLAVFPTPDLIGGMADMLHAAARTMPIVLFSMTPAADEFHRVGADNRGGMTDLTRHLFEAHGARTFAFVGDLTGPDFHSRFDAMRETLLAAGIPAPDAPLSSAGIAHEVDDDTALLPDGTLPDAVMCASDQLAIAVIEHLSTRGISVPDDVIVTGFDGILASRMLRPTLTTVRQPMAAMGRAAVRILISEATASSGHPVTEILPTALQLGESCGCD